MDRKAYKREWYRKKKLKESQRATEDRLQAYADIFEVNDANDMANIRQMVGCVASWDTLNNGILQALEEHNHKKVKDLMSALRDSVNVFCVAQSAVGIDRTTRLKQHEDFNIPDYISTLKRALENSSQYKKLICPNCTARARELAGDDREQMIGKYVYDGARMTVRMECPFCHQIVEESNEIPK